MYQKDVSFFLYLFGNRYWGKALSLGINKLKIVVIYGIICMEIYE
jgi:hypothetical protein